MGVIRDFQTVSDPPFCEVRIFRLSTKFVLSRYQGSLFSPSSLPSSGVTRVLPSPHNPLVRPSPGQRRAILQVGKEPACSIAPPRATDTVTSPHADTPTRWGVAGPGGRADRRRERLARRPSPDRTDQVRGVRRWEGGEEVGCPQRGRRAESSKRTPRPSTSASWLCSEVGTTSAGLTRRPPYRS